MRLTPNAKARAHYTVEKSLRVHNTAVSVNVKINSPIANGTTIGALCIRTPRLSYRYDSYRPVPLGLIGAISYRCAMHTGPANASERDIKNELSWD